MRDQLSAFCKLCGHFCVEARDGGPRVSDTWQKKYAAWRQLPPRLSRYGKGI
jgi:hypothetical protein